ncbi:MAG: PadR family transcriptional regulator [Firmicutes bacterium]|nr:PadR family transcriptional regulator [Bacillota bacterium]
MSVRHALLGLLEQKPRHGYELRAAFEAMVGGRGNWDVKPAQIYSTLARLEEGGLIEPRASLQDGGPERRVYAITPLGRAELENWLSSPVPANHQRDEFFLKLMLCLATGSDARQLIYAQRAGLYKELHALTARRDKADPDTELALILLLEQAMAHLEADLRWLEIIETRLDEVRRQPLPEPASRPRGWPRKDRTTGQGQDERR